MLSTKWNAAFDKAVTAYTEAVYHANLSNQQRRVAASSFLAWITHFRSGGTPAKQLLETELASKNVLRRNTAARILVELCGPEIPSCVTAIFDPNVVPRPDANILRLLGAPSSLPKEAWEFFGRLNTHEQVALVEALLRIPTDEGIIFVERSTTDEAVPIPVKQATIKSIAKWKRPDLLWGIVNNPSHVIHDLPPWLNVDIRLDAAFYLGLNGDRQAVGFLDTITVSAENLQAAHAAVRLAWLAWPGALGPTARLLHTENADAIELALGAASYLASAALGDALLELASQPPDIRSRFSGIALPDEAITVLSNLTGDFSFSDGQGNHCEDVVPDTLTDAARSRAISSCRDILQNLNPSQRYSRGEPLTLQHLTNNLSNPHDGPRRCAAYNLRSITGEDCGFDHDLDLVANLPAIIAWEKYIAESDVMKPGGWVFFGESLPDPKVQ